MFTILRDLHLSFKVNKKKFNTAPKVLRTLTKLVIPIASYYVLEQTSGIKSACTHNEDTTFDLQS